MLLGQPSVSSASAPPKVLRNSPSCPDSPRISFSSTSHESSTRR